MIFRRPCFLVFLFLSLFNQFTQKSFAENKNFSIGVEPALVEVVLEEPGEEKKVELTYLNSSDQPLGLEIFPIDFKQQDKTGLVEFLGREAGSYSYSLSSFLSFESARIDLEAGEKRKFLVSVKNRPDLSPGGHYAAVVARLIDTSEKSSSAKVTPSISALILVRKTGGERFNLSLIEVGWPKNPVVFGYPRVITLLFQNEGNVHLVPYGRLEIFDLFGRQLYKGVINTSSLRVFPSSRRYIKIEAGAVKPSLPFSINSLTVRGEDSLSKTNFLFKDSFIYLNPILIFLPLVGLSIVIVKKRQ